MKVYISPSNQNGNKYAYGGTNEMAVCNRIADKVVELLKINNFEAKKAPSGQDMYNSITESNRFNADLHICIHTNAGGGHGTEIYTFDKSAECMRYAEPIYNNLAKLTNSTRGIKQASFAEIMQTTAICIYVEAEFHDTTTLAKWIVNNINPIAKAIVQGICTGANKEYKDDNSHIYRVQVGAFTEKRGAENLAKELNAKGYKTIIKVD